MNNVDKLLQLDLVDNNEYFEKYKFIIDNREKVYNKYLQKHHIIPKSYYNYNNLSIDNSDENIAILHRSDHILAHYYLTLCSKQSWFKQSNAYAFIVMSKEYDISITEREVIDNLPMYESIYKEYLDELSRRQKLKVGALSTTGGCIAIYNKELDSLKFVKKDKLEHYLSLGYVKGGKPMSEEGKRKIGLSNSISLKGRHLPEDVKKKQSESLKKKGHSGEHNGSKIDGQSAGTDERREKVRTWSSSVVTMIKDNVSKKIKIFNINDYIKDGGKIRTKDKRLLNNIYEKCNKYGIILEMNEEFEGGDANELN